MRFSVGVGMKLHPFSIPYRSLERWFVLSAGGVPLGFFIGLHGFAIVALVVLLLVALFAWEVAYYRRFVYDLAPPVFKIKSGVISRREREIPLRRIQNVDINRNLVQRFLGLAVVRLETAGGEISEAHLRFVAFPHAKALQREIRHLKQEGEHPGEVPQPQRSGEVLFELEPIELLVLCLASFDARILGLIAFALPFVAPGVPWEWIPPAPMGALIVAIVAVLIVLASWVTGAFVTYITYHGFRLSRHGEDLQIERGLLSRYDGSVPIDKIQTLTLQDNPLKRVLGYATLKIETAGYSPQQAASEGVQSAVPLARLDRVMRLVGTLDDIEPITLEQAPRRARTRYMIRYALAVLALVGALLVVDLAYGIPEATGVTWYHPAPLALLAPLAGHVRWKHLGYAMQENHVITRSGYWSRHTKIVPYYRIQNAITTETILQRRWDLANLTADTAGSLSLHARSASALDIDAQTAQTVRETIHDRLQAALSSEEVKDLLAGEIGRSVLDEMDETTSSPGGDAHTDP